MMSTTADAKFEEMLRELGRFVHEFAQVESHLITTARVLTDAPPQFLRDLVGTWRVDAGITAIRNLLKNLEYSEDLKSDLDRPLVQLKEISSLRNALLHTITAQVPNPVLAGLVGKPADFDFGGGGFVATNVMYARTDEAIKMYPVSAGILHGAYEDLKMIMQYLASCEERILDTRDLSRSPRADVQGELEALRDKDWSWKKPQQVWKFATSQIT